MGRQQNAGIVFGEIHPNETTLQSSTGYLRVWTEGVLCLILARLVDPQDGSARPLSKGNRATRRDREDSCPQCVVQNRSQSQICRLECVAGRGRAYFHRPWRGTGGRRSVRSQCAAAPPPFARRVNATAMAAKTSTAAITAKVSLKPITSAWCFTALPSATMA
jgi:hypothetical protein